MFYFKPYHTDETGQTASRTNTQMNSCYEVKQWSILCFSVNSEDVHATVIEFNFSEGKANVGAQVLAAVRDAEIAQESPRLVTGNGDGQLDSRTPALPNTTRQIWVSLYSITHVQNRNVSCLRRNYL